MLRKVSLVALFLVSIAFSATVIAAPTEASHQPLDLAQLLEAPAQDSCASADPLVSSATPTLGDATQFAPSACQAVRVCCRNGNANCCAVMVSVCG